MTTRDIRWAAALLLGLAGLHGCAAPEGRSGGEEPIAPAVGGEEQEPPDQAAKGEEGTGVAPAAPQPVVPSAVADDHIDLAAALGLAGADNPTIAIAAEAVRASQARLLEAQTLLLPTLDAGVSVDAHDGNLISSRGIIRDVNRESVYVGAGAAAVGAGTVSIPGARITAQVADAVFEPHVARQFVASRTADAAATQNVVLLDVALAYIDLASAEASLASARQSLGEVDEVTRLLANFAKPGIGQARPGDAERARDQMEVVTAQEQGAQEAVAVASAELARLLSADPAVRLHTPGGPLPLLQLVDPNANLESLIEVALRSRPEVAARSADVGLFAVRLRQEKVRPFVPFLSIGYSAGTFGGGGTGTDPRFGKFDGRTDFDAMAVWSLDNFGFGNLAVQRRVRAQLGEAEAERRLTIDQVRREVAEPFTEVEAARLQVEVTTRRVRTAEEGFRLDLRGVRNIQARPIEVLNSATLLNTARQDLIGAITSYDRAQLRLFWAIGRPMPLAPCGAAPLTTNTTVIPNPLAGARGR